MNASRLPNAVLAVVVLCLTTAPALAMCPCSPTPTLGPPPIGDAVTLWTDGQNLTVYVDSTRDPDNQNKLTTLEVKLHRAFVNQMSFDQGRLVENVELVFTKIQLTFFDRDRTGNLVGSRVFCWDILGHVGGCSL